MASYRVRVQIQLTVAADDEDDVEAAVDEELMGYDVIAINDIVRQP